MDNLEFYRNLIQSLLTAYAAVLIANGESIVIPEIPQKKNLISPLWNLSY
jgi:hypothetical protein